MSEHVFNVHRSETNDYENNSDMLTGLTWSDLPVPRKSNVHIKTNCSRTILVVKSLNMRGKLKWLSAPDILFSLQDYCCL